ncbi:MAG: lipocalin family protein [Pseudohongiella sp.]|uniref:lipocalin family protein n=1 Tax=Pseudohongiella sp. TaxID=1979412 RepID=UPI0034A07EB2
MSKKPEQSASIRLLAVLLFTLTLAACSSAPPDGLSVVDNFDINRYTGRWYEIARLDHRFERGLSNVTAEYELQEDNSVSVLNRGYNNDEQQWDEADGRAKFVGDPSQGSLKVSFFGPFYGGYHIIALDQDDGRNHEQDSYQWAMISGPSRDYLWILAREPVLDSTVYDALIKQAGDSGFAIEDLIEVDQSRNLP